MKIHATLGAFVLGVGATLLTSMALTQDKSGAPVPDDMAKGMQKWMESMKPGKGHDAMKPMIGAFDATAKVFPMGPSGAAIDLHGTLERKWVLDGRFMTEEYRGDSPLKGMMPGAPANMSGMGMFGYDNYRHMYVGSWADTMGTQLLTMTGTADPAGKVFTYYGEMDEPMLGVVGRTVRYRTTIVDADTQVFEITDLHGGDDYKVYEITYKRKK